ncbi:ABC transporter substrate-binding protein [Roseomonas sp. CCTCC AB2023176]|uniref:ABC transporter substrate-binding protein n=1 Tax=Roseomonas sp. CCTCC AB2023176 TaxID=3342640 RepID=UPI0035DFB64A
MPDPTRRVLLAGLSASLAVSALAQGTTTGDLRPVEVIVFPGGFNWPIWVAQEKGFFARHGIRVNVTPTPNSVFQLTHLIDGRFDVAMTAVDNVIAYMEGQGEGPTQRPSDLAVFVGGDNGFLKLVTVPEVARFEDLRGKDLSVDALTTGYAFVLRKLLQQNGLRDEDVRYVRAGGVLQRFEALLAKQHAGTMLISPFEALAEARGFRVLADAAGAFGHYQGLVGAARREWLASHKAEAVGYIRGTIDALAWLYDPSNRAEAQEILRKNVPTMSPQVAEASARILLHPTGGFERRAAVDVEGIRTVLALRSEFGPPGTRLTDPMKYLDLSHYREAAPG